MLECLSIVGRISFCLKYCEAKCTVFLELDYRWELQDPYRPGIAEKIVVWDVKLQYKLEMRVCKTLCPQLYACPKLAACMIHYFIRIK